MTREDYTNLTKEQIESIIKPVTREEFRQLTSEEIGKRIAVNDFLNMDRINSEILKNKTAYKVSDSEGNIFVYGYLENGYPVFRGMGGSKHIFDLNGYTVLEQLLN